MVNLYNILYINPCTVCFLMFTIINNAQMITECKYLSNIPISMLLDIHPDTGLLNPRIIAFLVFLRNLYTIFQDNRMNLSSYRSLCTSLLILDIFSLFANIHLNRCEVISHCDFVLYFPDDCKCAFLKHLLF
jgi:hypothetical protein